MEICEELRYNFMELMEGFKLSYLNKDNRILYDIDVYKYTVSDVDKIYQECKSELEKYNINDLKFLYNLFRIKQKKKFVYSMSEIFEDFSERIAIVARSSNIKNIRAEVRKCRRKFYYWGDLPTYVYFINEELDYYRTNRKFKDDIKISKDYYDCWIAYACYKIILNN